MRTSIKIATGAALLMLGATAASAQNAEYDFYVTGQGENRMVMSRAGGEGTAVLGGEAGARPGDCPEGSFYETADGGVAACGDDAMFDMAEPESSMKMESGEAFEQGTMILRPRESGSSKQGESGATGGASGGASGGGAGGATGGGG